MRDGAVQGGTTPRNPQAKPAVGDRTTYGSHPVTMFQQLLTNPKAETLMKAGEKGLFRYLCHNPKEVDKYWDTIKVARRTGYKVDDPQMWFDYIKMLDRMGRYLHSPTLVAPKDLKAVHDEYVAKAERQRIKEQRERPQKSGGRRSQVRGTQWQIHRIGDDRRRIILLRCLHSLRVQATQRRVGEQ